VSYFESVMVMDDDPLIRENRLNTLRALNQALTQIAAFDALQQ
jgi:glycyl-tRNA synthetase beta subunit